MAIAKISEEKIRYLIVGGWNTVFGYACFVFLNYLLTSSTHYIVTLVVSYIVSITNAYICYKFFVFKTKGNYLKEYLRFYLVYGIAFILNLILLPVFVEWLKISILISQGAIIFLTVIISYFGHKHFSFQVAPNSNN